jgi:dienelactone hydrolase
MVREIEFRSDGETVRGDLYLPDGEGPHPVVVMAGGWCYVKELVQPHYAEHFVNAGLAALVIDYRRLGASDGSPRFVDLQVDPDRTVRLSRSSVGWRGETRYTPTRLDTVRVAGEIEEGRSLFHALVYDQDLDLPAGEKVQLVQDLADRLKELLAMMLDQ